MPYGQCCLVIMADAPLRSVLMSQEQSNGWAEVLLLLPTHVFHVLSIHGAENELG